MRRLGSARGVSEVGVQSSPVAQALAGLRANEARYFMSKYKHEFTVEPAGESRETLDYVNRILKEERGIELSSKHLETSRFQVENIRMAYVFYEDGLAVNVMYTVDDPKKRAVGFKLSEGMEVGFVFCDQRRILTCKKEKAAAGPLFHDVPRLGRPGS